MSVIFRGDTAGGFWTARDYWLPSTFAVVEAPATEPITLAFAKIYLRIDADQTRDDPVLTHLLKAAREQVERDASKILITQTLDLVFDGYPRAGALRLPFGPVQSITHIRSYNAAGDEATVSAADYVLEAGAQPPRVRLASGATWPTDVRVASGGVLRGVFGYGGEAAVPTALKTAILELVQSWFFKTPLTPQYETFVQRVPGVA